MCAQTAAQKRALNNALNATSAPGLMELDGAMATFSLFKNGIAFRYDFVQTWSVCMRSDSYLFGFGSKTSRFGFVFSGLFFLGNGVISSVLVNRCLIAGILVLCS